MTETHVDPTWVQLSYLVAAVLFILALKSMSSPRTARTGVLLGRSVRCSPPVCCSSAASN